MKKNETTAKRRIPKTPLTRFLDVFLRLFYRRKVIGGEKVDSSQPSVFVCNHGFTSGPISAVLYFPFPFRVWINSTMLNCKEAAASMEDSFRDNFKLVGRWGRKAFCRVASWLVCRVLKSFDHIPVYKGYSRKTIETITLSVDALERGENLLIFPEKPDDGYDDETFREFNTGFATLGRAYYKRTGRRLVFYPVFSDGPTNMFLIGEPVTFDPENEAHAEKIRIATELQERVTGLKDKLLTCSS